MPEFVGFQTTMVILDPYGMSSDAVGVFALWSGLLTFFKNLDYHMYCADLDIFYNLHTTSYSQKLRALCSKKLHF